MKQSAPTDAHDRVSDSAVELAARANAPGTITEQFAQSAANVQHSEQQTARESAAVAAAVNPLRQPRDPLTGRFLKLPPGAVGARTNHALHTQADHDNQLPAPYEFLRAELDTVLRRVRIG